MPTQVEHFYVNKRQAKKAGAYIRRMTGILPPDEQSSFLKIPVTTVPGLRRNMLLATGAFGKKLFWVNLRSNVVRKIEE